MWLPLDYVELRDKEFVEISTSSLSIPTVDSSLPGKNVIHRAENTKSCASEDRRFPLKAQTSTPWSWALDTPHTYLQGCVDIHGELRDLVSPRQEFFSFVVQIIIKDGSLGWKLHCFHFFMPPSTKVGLIIRKLWRTGELFSIDPESIHSPYKFCCMQGLLGTEP